MGRHGLFLFIGKPGSNNATRSERSPRVCVAPQILMQVGPHSNKCSNGPQEATPKTRPPATPTLGRRPQLNGQPTTARTLMLARSIKSTPLSNSEGPRKGCAAGEHAQHFGPFLPPTSCLHDAPQRHKHRPCDHSGYPQQIVVPGSPVLWWLAQPPCTPPHLLFKNGFHISCPLRRSPPGP